MPARKIEIIPSISILNNKITRLKQGDFEKEQVYNDSPVDLAKKFEDHGIRKLQLVDLDGTRNGKPVNYHILEAIAGHTRLEIDFAGGINTDGDVNKAFDYGAKKITAATVAVKNPSEFASWVVSYGREKIALGADALSDTPEGRKVAIQGWQQGTQIDLFDHVEYFYSRSLKFLKTSDISKEGQVEGPAFNLYRDLMDKFPGIKLIASGGVHRLEDIERLQEIGLYGVVFGKAYYEGMITLKQVEEFLSR
uniref:1-(5-phosphoribosyl)-5-[(5-phosphoribosylamino)methylideneamino] imidazole-4-carboxamide isomerase n=1 Tax=Roseihalotalea indica TaxID=2867963 RepID=A0AA49PZ95_9BACT|nr:1-(5-phosphoribosyl)-5-[(5-phosphoribosylamino)methylideneamino] imidazole-4-carboxamide isomerase [Tunicatimonas sp. TK19036]